MLETARINIARAGLSERVSLAVADASDFDALGLFGTVHFDRIFLSYTLSMIPAWEAALDRAAAVLAPGGRLKLIDFGQQERLPGAFRTALFRWLACFDVSPRAGLPQAIREIGSRYAFDARWTPKLLGYAWAADISRPA